MNPPPPVGRPSPGRELPAILRKILFTLLGGVVAYTVTNFTQQEQVWVLTMTIFISGVVLLVQFLVDFDERLRALEYRQHDYHENMTAMVDKAFSKISEATELFGLVEASAVRTDRITQLVRHSTEVKRIDPPIIYNFAQTEIARLSRFLKELGDGENVSYDGEDRDWLLALTLNVENSLDATSLSTVDAGGGRGYDAGFWLTDLGQRYLDFQSDLVQRGVKIRRLFILDDAHQMEDPEFGRLCQQQVSLGIDVRTLDPARVVGTSRAALFDFILFDNVVSYELRPASRFREDARPTFVDTRLVITPERVRERIRHFNGLWDLASPFAVP